MPVTRRGYWLAARWFMVMTPGLGLFYAGMVRRKNALGTILQSLIMVALVGVLWVVYGYSLAFGRDHWGLIGSLDWIFFRNVGLDPNPDYAATIPHQAFAIYQAMFAIITPALITGAFAGPGAAQSLRAMAELGVLQAIVPRFGELMSFIPGDATHKFTVGEHSLRAVENLGKLFSEPNDQFVDIFSRIQNLEVLFLATLMHDIGKLDTRRDHSRAGASIARKFAAQLGMGVAESQIDGLASALGATG